LLVEVISQLLRNKKILAQAQERAQKKALYLALEIEEEGKDINVEEINYLALVIGIAFSPTM
jgi:hypothetical protein